MNRVYLLSAALVLSVAIVGSGLVLVTTKHSARQLFAELEDLNREQDRLEVDWGRLRLELSTRATHPRIETRSRESLGLTDPIAGQIVIIAGAPQ